MGKVRENLDVKLVAMLYCLGGIYDAALPVYHFLDLLLCQLIQGQLVGALVVVWLPLPGREAVAFLFLWLDREQALGGGEVLLCRAALFRCGCGQVLPGGLSAILGRCAPSPQPGLCCFSCHSVIAAFRRNISTYHKGVIGAFRPLVLRLTWRRYRVIFLVGRSVPALRPPL